MAVHIKTQNKVAIKVIKKKHMSLKELELQKREIEVLKICQHPNIIRLIDVFENPDYIYIGNYMHLTIQFLSIVQAETSSSTWIREISR